MSNRLAVYTDMEYVPRGQDGNELGLCGLLAPFYQQRADFPWYKKHDVFKEYNEKASEYFVLVDSIEEADCVVLPCSYSDYIRHNKQDLAHRFGEIAAQAQKMILVFNRGDYDFKFPTKNSILFSPTIERRSPDRHEFGLPGWAPDHLAGGEVPVRAKQEAPSVSFCGRVLKPSPKNRAIQFLRIYFGPTRMEQVGSSETSFDVSQRYRHRFIRYQGQEQLKATPGVVTDFIERSQFFAGVQKDEQWDQKQVDKANQEFVDNILNNDYVLCARGSGNFSFRFYETLACGRFPLFLNSNCVLPYDFIIDWKKEIPWVEFQQMNELGERLLKFHRAMSPEEFEQKQLDYRELWSEWLSPNGFFKNIYRHLEHVK